jgi:hypothetical protein
MFHAEPASHVPYYFPKEIIIPGHSCLNVLNLHAASRTAPLHSTSIIPPSDWRIYCDAEKFFYRAGCNPDCQNFGIYKTQYQKCFFSILRILAVWSLRCGLPSRILSQPSCYIMYVRIVETTICSGRAQTLLRCKSAAASNSASTCLGTYLMLSVHVTPAARLESSTPTSIAT